MNFELKFEKVKTDLEANYDMLRDFVGISEEALDLAIAIGGYNKNTLEKILYFYTGWGNFEDFYENEILEEE